MINAAHMKTQLPVPVITSGRGFVLVDKPCGMSVHNDAHNLCTVISEYFKSNSALLEQAGFNPSFGVHAVNRLDRETSGVILLACNPRTFKYFSNQFEKRNVQKKYVALLHGDLQFKNDQANIGLWSWPLSKKAGGREVPAGKGDKQLCETRVKILKKSLHYTFVECELHTGRIHQIRRHAKLAGHPVVGDKRYGSPRSLKFLKEKRGFNRMALHSMYLRIPFPEVGKPKEISSLKIPEEIEKLLLDDLNTP